jgi:hypothetical protein
MSDLEDIVFQGLGEASMCWSETPKGVFDSVNAKRIGEEIMQAIKQHEHDFDMRFGEYDLVRWCRHCGLTFVAYRPSPYKEFSTFRQVKDEEAAEFLINQS